MMRMCKMLSNYGLALLFLCSSFIAAAQENNPLINSGDLLDKGEKLHDAGKYKEAIVLYKKISRSDTNYYRALNELSLSCYMDSQFEASKQYAELGLKLFPVHATDFYNLLANDLDELGNKEQAIAYYDKILALDKNDYVAWFNKGITLYNEKKYAEAGACFEKTLIIYPYYASAHFFLGNVYLQEGNLVPAFLSLTAGLVVNPENKYLNNTIGLLTSIAVAKDEVLGYANAAKPFSADNFDMQQEILLNKIALDSKYKLQTDLEDPITRQLQVMLEKLGYNRNDTGFCMQFYVPFYKQVFNDGKYDAFVNYIFSGLSIKSVQSYNKRNKKQIDDIINTVVTYFNSIKETQTLNVEARKNVRQYYLFENKTVSGKGEWRGEGKDQVLVGPWEFYYSNGQVKSKGLLNNDQLKEGVWDFYNEDGQEDEKSTYKNGVAEGKSTSWFTNGNVYEEAAYKNDKYDGERRQYYFNGLLRTVENYTEGKKNGPAKGYIVSGELSYTAIYKDDKLEGELKYFHPNGKTESTSLYTNGLANGSYKKFSAQGILIKEGNYTDDKANGIWKEFYASGKPYKTYSFTDGDIDGLYTEYYENGSISETLQYIKGKIDGKESDYDEDGKLYSESVYEKGRTREVKFYDKTGKTISSATTRNGAGNLAFYDADGNKTSEGYFTKDGLRDGKTTYYFKNGKVRISANYKNGDLDGERIVYYANGNMAEKVNYTDDKEDGYFTSYFENGKKKDEGWYVGGDRQGQHISYNVLGDTISKVYYKDGDEHGYAEYFYANGKPDYEQRFSNSWIKYVTQFDSTGSIVSETDLAKGTTDFVFKNNNGKDYIRGSYKNYYLNGKYQVLYFDGTASTTDFYKYGYRDSLYKSYYYGGKVKTEGAYQRGDKTGTWKYYFPNGRLNYAEEYADGMQQGKQVMYDEDGKLDKEMNYKDDDLEGEYKIFGDDNQLAVLLNYHNGNVVSYTYEQKDGKLAPAILLPNGTGLVTAYYKNGTKSAEINFENGTVNGVRKLFFSNGKIYVDGTRLLGYEDGPKRAYAPNGQLLEDENYVHGNQQGPAKYYYTNGKLKAEENWYDDDKNGECKYYDESGKLKQTMYYYFGILQSVK